MIYASRLLCRCPASAASPSPTNTTRQHSTKFRNISALSLEELRTIACIYDLVCHLIHCGQSFLDQFCDAIDILGVAQLLIDILAINITSSKEIERLKKSILGILGFVLRESPGHAERIVEKVIFNEKVDICKLLCESCVAIR